MNEKRIVIIVDMPKTTETELSFTAASAELESVVRNLESGSLELEDSLAQFERGVALIKDLKQRLNVAEQKVEVLLGEIRPESTDEVDSSVS